MKINYQLKDGEFALKHEMIDFIIQNTNNFRDRLIISLLYKCAMRRFEVCNMLIERIDFNTGRFIVYGKRNKVRVIPVGSVFPELISELKHFIGNNKKGYLFTHNWKEENKKLSTVRINQILKEITLKYDLKNPNPNKKYINPHSFRHSLARHLKSQGYRDEFIQKYLGHTLLQTTQDTYGTLSIDEMEQMAVQIKNVKYIE